MLTRCRSTPRCSVWPIIFGFSMGWTMGSEASEFIRSGPHIQSLEEPDQLGLNSVMLAAPTSNGLSQSALSDRLVRAGLVYGFGTSGFRIGMGYTQLPLENHSYLACNPARYRLIHSADQREQLSFGLGGALGRRFAISGSGFTGSGSSKCAGS